MTIADKALISASVLAVAAFVWAWGYVYARDASRRPEARMLYWIATGVVTVVAIAVWWGRA